MFDKDEFAKIINDFYKKDKYLARHIGITANQFYAYRTATNNPSMDFIRRFCSYYEISADKLLGTKNPGKKTVGANAWCDTRYNGAGMFWMRLKAAIEVNDLSQQMVAESLGMSTQTISNYVNGLTTPNGAVIVDLCEYLDVSADWLLGLA